MTGTRASHRRGASALLAGLCVLLLVQAPHASAGTERPGWKFWELTRVTSSGTQIFPVISASYGESRVILAGAFLRRVGGSTTVVSGGGMLSDEGRTAPSAYAAGKSLRCSETECATAPARGFLLLGLTYHDTGASDRTPNVLAFAAYGRDVQINAAERGWSLRTVRRSAAVVWTTDGAGATGVQAQQLGAEYFQEASLPGGPRGSLAWGQLPCTSHFGLASSGAGTATLTGGEHPATSTCPTDSGALGGAARGAVTWRLTGPVVGTTAVQFSTPGPVRLLVLSY